MTNCKKILIGSLILFFLVSACSDENESGEHQAVIEVNGHALTLAEFNEFFEAVRTSYSKGRTNDGAGLREARIQFLLQLLEEMIILRRAEELGLHVSAEELEKAVQNIQKDYSEGSFQEMFIKQAISFKTWKTRVERHLLIEKVVFQELLEQVSVTPEEIKAYFDKHQEQWVHGEQRRVYHILLPNKKLAMGILKRLKKGEDFATLARLYSIAPESKQSGDMGYVERGQLPKSLETPVFALSKGKVSRVIKTPYGYHIFRVVEKRKASKPSVDDWIDKIREIIKKEKMEAAYGPWLARLRTRYNITVNKEII